VTADPVHADALAPSLGAVLFDMDGTLIDTEKLWDVALRELAARYGGVLSDRARIAMTGSSAPNTMRLLREDLGLSDVDLSAGAAWLIERTSELFSAGIPWRPGAAELLAAVRTAAIPTALVTNTGRGLVMVALRTLGEANFDAVLCGDEVAFAKPHAGPYLAAAQALGVEPARCVAIEDSPTGLASARAAGCVLLAVPNDVPLREADIAGATVRSSLLEVDVPFLRRLVARRY
jgi:HAD superfamily hydrolase (TIGR01509 family)